MVATTAPCSCIKGLPVRIIGTFAVPDNGPAIQTVLEVVEEAACHLVANIVAGLVARPTERCRMARDVAGLKVCGSEANRNLFNGNVVNEDADIATVGSCIRIPDKKWLAFVWLSPQMY